MFEDMMGAYGGRFFIAAAGVGVALLLLVGVLWLMRNRAPSPFIRGGKNRQPRLQVLDAAAVDARRRLVLVRRDDVEHLIMIGGPTDVVIESRIGTREGEAIATPVPPAVMAATPVQPTRPEPRPTPQPAERPIARTMERQEPAATPPTPTARIEPPIASQSVRPADSQPAGSDTRANQAVEILEAARQRVLPPRPDIQERPAPLVDILPPEQPTPALNEARPPEPPARPRQPDNEFQRVLEDEMSSNLAADRLVPRPLPTPPPRQIPPGPIPQQQRRDPDMAPITGSDASLQTEVARIFGEMSVNRDH